MRKILISILIVLLLVVSYIISFKGLNVFGIDILSLKQIKDKNMELDIKLKEVSTLTSVDQPKAISDLNDSAKQLTIAKEEYNDKIIYSSSDNISLATQLKTYKTEYLGIRIGNHAKKNAVNLKYELMQSTSGVKGLYDIYFTVTGRYVSISEFVASLENDSSLNFKIENFRLQPNKNNTEILQATFNVKDISVEIDNINKDTNNDLAQ